MSVWRESPAELVAGAVVIVIAGVFLVYAGQFAGAPAAARGDYSLSASFRSAEGVQVGTDVRLAGVSIGTVTDLGLNPQTFRADAAFAIDESVVLPDDSSAAVASEGLLGGTYIDIQPGGSPFDIEPGGEIENTQSAVSLIDLMLRFVTGATE